MYQNLYDLIMSHVYGGVVSVTPDMELVATLIATTGCIFLISLPFLLVWRFIRLFV